MRAPNPVYGLILGIGAILAPTVVEAQVNYDILPGFFFTNPPPNRIHNEWTAAVLSRRTSKLYQCTAGTDANNNNLSIRCSPVDWFNGTSLNGPDVVTVQTRNPGTGLTGDFADFWQLDRNTGELQFCFALDHPQGAPSCIRIKLR